MAPVINSYARTGTCTCTCTVYVFLFFWYTSTTYLPPPPYFHSDHLVGVSCTRSGAMCKVGNTDVEGWCYKSYWLSANAAITLHESTKMVSAATTGLCTWNGALTLAEWVLEHRSVFAGKCVVELGSGIGLASTTYTHRHIYT